MACSITCFLSAVFVVAMICMTNWMSTNQTTQKYQAQLPDKLQKIYSDIVQERREIFYTGYGIGFFIALFILFYNIRIRKEKVGWGSMICFTVSIAFLTNYFYYILTPKTKWMLEYIDSPEQTKAWFTLYRTMQVYYHGSLVLGLVAIALLTFAFRLHPSSV